MNSHLGSKKSLVLFGIRALLVSSFALYLVFVDKYLSAHVAQLAAIIFLMFVIVWWGVHFLPLEVQVLFGFVIHIVSVFGISKGVGMEYASQFVNILLAAWSVFTFFRMNVPDYRLSARSVSADKK